MDLLLILDVPIYGRIATLKLFRLHGEAQDSLFIETERYTFCVLKWDSQTSKLVTWDISSLLSSRAVRSVFGWIAPPLRIQDRENVFIDPDCRLFGFCYYNVLESYNDSLFIDISGDSLSQLWSGPSSSSYKVCVNVVLVAKSMTLSHHGPFVEVMERYVNLGPIFDFCVADFERQGQRQVVTCSGKDKDSSLRVVCNGIDIMEQASVKVQGIKGIWSLRSSTDDPFDTFLVVSFISATRILKMNIDVLEDTEIHGFCSQLETLFCHDAVHNQLVQVGSTTRELRNEWFAPLGFSVNVTTANATQWRQIREMEVGEP
ncbi:hypothetical protein V8G54_011073 [Vigna mungo]|uniref:Uncharacterized protein n=1 Tax=Vigna mungo TaxID=3915 RepID=A0AAQ3NRL8_VIGMU